MQRRVAQASRMRCCIRDLANLALPFLFFYLLYLSTRQPLLDVAIREEVTAGTLRVFEATAIATEEVTAADAVRVSDGAAIATADADTKVTADEPRVSSDAGIATEDADAKVTADELRVSSDAGIATQDAGAKGRTDALRVSDDAAVADTDTNGVADAVAFDFQPYVRLYKSGSVVRFHGTDTVSPGVDALTGVASMDVAIDGATGVSARLYLPKNHLRKGRRGKKKLPVLLYFHGGAFVIESAFSPLYHAFLNVLVSKAGVVAVSVNYRLAPEHPLPAAYDDAWTALQWTISNCQSGPEAWLASHGDATRVFLVGDSAGGNIAHNLAVRAGAERPLQGAAIAGVVLLNPYFWGSEPVGSEPGVPWIRDGLEKTWAFVCGGRYGIDHPHVNPLVAPEAWRGMAGERVLVTIAGRDNFRERGAAYAAGLRSCGWRGEVEVYVTEGEAHVHFVGNPRSEKAVRETAKVAEFIAGRG